MEQQESRIYQEVSKKREGEAWGERKGGGGRRAGVEEEGEEKTRGDERSN